MRRRFNYRMYRRFPFPSACRPLDPPAARSVGRSIRRPLDPPLLAAAAAAGRCRRCWPPPPFHAKGMKVLTNT